MHKLVTPTVGYMVSTCEVSGFDLFFSGISRNKLKEIAKFLQQEKHTAQGIVIKSWTVSKEDLSPVQKDNFKITARYSECINYTGQERQQALANNRIHGEAIAAHLGGEYEGSELYCKFDPAEFDKCYGKMQAA